MNLIKQALTAVAARALEGRAARKTYEEMAVQMDGHGRKLQARLAQLPPTPDNRRVMRHIIGIERWGQSRLRCALGAPLVMDEYTGYRPPRDMSWDALRDEFAATRGATVDLARRLAWSPLQMEAVPHNDVGPLTPKGWLVYLDGHAHREARRLR